MKKIVIILMALLFVFCACSNMHATPKNTMSTLPLPSLSPTTITSLGNTQVSSSLTTDEVVPPPMYNSISFKSIEGNTLGSDQNGNTIASQVYRKARLLTYSCIKGYCPVSY